MCFLLVIFVWNTLLQSSGKEVHLIEKEKVVTQMPVAKRTRPPFGVLHGGASVALAETVASISAYKLVNKGMNRKHYIFPLFRIITNKKEN